jgi:lactobin A/cerein 7B family class IIb bacteriocin
MKKELVELKPEELKEIQGGVFPWVLLGVAFLIGVAWAILD